MKLFFPVLPLLITAIADGQPFNANFKILPIKKKVKDFPDKFDLSSALNSFITLKYILINGKDGLQRKICSANKKSSLPDSTAFDSEVPADIKQQHLNTVIQEIVLYKDSVAFVISQLTEDNGDVYYSVRNFHPENANWVVNGEDLFRDIESANKYIHDRAEYFYRDFLLNQKTY